MKKYIITYTLKDYNRDYSDLYMQIREKYPENKHIVEHSWLIKTNDSSKDIYSAIKPHCGPHDFLFVAQITSDYEGWLGQSVWSWLNDSQNIDKEIKL